MWKNCKKNKKSYKNTFKLRKLDPQINMPCIVSRALVVFTNPKDKRLSKCNLSACCCQKSTKKDKICDPPYEKGAYRKTFFRRFCLRYV